MNDRPTEQTNEPRRRAGQARPGEERQSPHTFLRYGWCRNGAFQGRADFLLLSPHQPPSETVAPANDTQDALHSLHPYSCLLLLALVARRRAVPQWK